MPDAHLPSIADGWTCRACSTAWPCITAAEHLMRIQCSTCGSATWSETSSPRSWHVGPRCYTEAEGVAARAEDAAKGRAPHYPPSHYYPPKPHRPVRQRPPYRHTPTGPGDIQPGTTVWVKPGGLHPGWGNIHQLAVITRVDAPKCEAWLILDGSVHQVRADRMILDDGPRNDARAAGHDLTRQEGGRWYLLPDWQWLGWTIAEHLEHRQVPAPAPAAEPVQETLFPADHTGCV
ncbi:hypothetical protein AB0A05_07360 [Streptomyces sp. NPDC046374]|uniref:hypothetical protein n=1 Tax=Streptomyces sp. NPDC046374 TaxID=3154917 RepID=UPI0033FA9833